MCFETMGRTRTEVENTDAGAREPGFAPATSWYLTRAGNVTFCVSVPLHPKGGNYTPTSQDGLQN